MLIFLTITLSILSLIIFFIICASLYCMIKYHDFSIACIGNFLCSIVLAIILYFSINSYIYNIGTKLIREEYQQLIINEDYGPVFNNKYENDIIAFYDTFVVNTSLSIENKKDIYNQYKKLEFNRFVKVTSLENLQNSTYKSLYSNINKNDETIKSLINNIKDVTDIIFSKNTIQFKIEQKIPKKFCHCGECYNIKTRFIDLTY